MSKKIVIIDFGHKAGIKRSLEELGCAVEVLSANTSYKEIEKNKPDAIILSNGHGNPEDYKVAIKNIKEMIIGGIPIFGICLGHQLLALAAGGKTIKLLFGHRGNNHSVLDLEKNRAFITSHNHGYTVSRNEWPKDFFPWFVSLLDNTIEGMKHKEKIIWSVQFHPEANPGPWDTKSIFLDFISKV